MTKFYIVDLRPSFRSNWAVTFWRPEDSGYCYPLSWAGKYTEQQVLDGGTYYLKREGRSLTRFAVPCHVADAITTPTPPGRVDGDAGPVVLRTAKNLMKLRRNASNGPHKRYVIQISGYDSFDTTAPNAAKAKAAAWRQWQDAGLPGTFKEFIGRVSVLHMGAA